MKILLKKLFVGASLFGAFQAQASGFENYARSMDQQDLPKVLIVGCGHSAHYGDGDHTHPNSWCVNLETDPRLKGFAHNTKEQFKEAVQYDEVLDIKMFHLPLKSRQIRESLPIRDAEPVNKFSKTVIGYKNTFDVVLLERPLPETLNKPWTLWNAVHMLKVSGELIIDSTQGYNSHLYVKNERFMLDDLCPSQKDRQYSVNMDAGKLEQFGISPEQGKRFNSEMLGISDYLSFWGMSRIINVGSICEDRHLAYQPYTKIPGQGLETARRTCILSATKTQETEDRMEAWASAIQRVRGHIMM